MSCYRVLKDATEDKEFNRQWNKMIKSVLDSGDQDKCFICGQPMKSLHFLAPFDMPELGFPDDGRLFFFSLCKDCFANSDSVPTVKEVFLKRLEAGIIPPKQEVVNDEQAS